MPASPRLRRARDAVRSRIDAAEFARPRTALVTALLLMVMMLGAAVMPAPYVIEQPGPAIDVLGEYEDEAVLSIDGQETYPSEGELMMTTVSVDGGPGFRVTPAEVVVSWFDPTRSVMPRELMFPEGETAEEVSLRNSVQMSTSQQEAVAVALEELGIEYETVVMIGGVLAGAPAEDTLRAGDVIVSVAGQTAPDTAGYQRLVAATPAGEDVPMTVVRDGTEMQLEVPTETVDGSTQMGVVLADGYRFPFDIDISVGPIGGPSAGLMFSLSVYDALTPGALPGAESVAGTGTIGLDGEIGSIGGVRQKMVGAEEEGADFFLAPGGNCADVAGSVPDGLQVVRVDTFDQALESLDTIASTGSAEGLATCEEP